MKISELFGQALEARDISVFELKRLTDSYVIQGLPEQTGSLRSKVRQWLRRLRSGSTAELLALGLADVEKLSQAGRAKRSNPGQLTDFHSVSNTMRTIGAYLDSREAELVELHKRRISITLCIETKQATNEKKTELSLLFIGCSLSFAESESRRNNAAPVKKLNLKCSLCSLNTAVHGSTWPSTPF